jgi:hypothetical protein
MPYLLRETNVVFANVTDRIRSDDTGASTTAETERGDREYILMLRRYKPGRYPGNLTLIVNTESKSGDRTLGWSKCIDGNVEVHRFTGSHDRFWKNPDLARQLRKHLER